MGTVQRTLVKPTRSFDSWG